MTVFEASLGWAQLILPFAVIGCFAIMFPIWLSKRMPDGYGPLILNFVLTITICLSMATGFFIFEYTRLGTPFEAFLNPAALFHVVRLAVLSALFWGPLVILACASRVQTWRPEL